MNKTGLTLVAILCAASATTALAQTVNIGTVNIDRRDGRDVHTFDLGGPIESLRLRARGSDSDCRSIRARFGNGRTRTVFQGRLRENRSTNIDLPGNQRNITQLTFNCSPQGRRGGEIRIAADVGRYRDQWQRGPNFDRVWSKIFNWGSNTINNWRLVGSERFEGRNDTEQRFVGQRGHHIDSIALKPLDADARCSRVTARFENGHSQNLALHNGDLLRRGRLEQLDLPGNNRNLQSLSLRCRATDARQVTIQIFSNH
jgi:hypothetical protein